MLEISLNTLLFLVGLTLLIIGSDWLIQGAVKFSFLFRLTPLFVGAIVVAFGTSAPEAGVGIIAAIENEPAIAFGDIVGSNIANIGLILGLCALFRPLGVNKNIFKRELPIMILASVLLYVLSFDLIVSRMDGLIFILLFIIFCFISYKGAKESTADKEIKDFKFKKSLASVNKTLPVLAIAIISLLGIVLGADLMVRGGGRLARIFGISPWLIGITIFAIGTSLPELGASLTASIRKVPSISVGNIVGSNTFNILFVLGIVSLIRPVSVSASVLRFELPVMLAFSVILFTVMRTKYRITRWEGLIMVLGYICFISFLLGKHLIQG